MKVCHFTSVHNTADDRIFLKECQSLQKNGYDVYLVGKGESREQEGIHIVGCGETTGKLQRLVSFSDKVYQKAAQLDCDIYHFHDPELLPYGLKLKKKGKIVIFDSHEDVPAQILDKKWIPEKLRKTVSAAYKKYETHVVRHLDAVITATDHIADQFKGRARKTTVIQNYPKLGDIQFHETPFAQREAIVCYAGGISEDRGEKIMIDAMKDVDGKLIIAGSHEKMQVGDKVEYIGMQDRTGVNALYGKSVAGLCILKPIKNYFYSQPIKMYEYMAAGLPFVCSDFPGWKKIVEDSQSGICVDPSRPDEIGKAIAGLLADREKAQEMGRRGHEYVLSHFTWENEEEKLLKLYAELK